MPRSKQLSKAAVAHGRTMEEQIIALLQASLDREETDTNQRH